MTKIYNIIYIWICLLVYLIDGSFDVGQGKWIQGMAELIENQRIFNSLNFYIFLNLSFNF